MKKVCNKRMTARSRKPYSPAWLKKAERVGHAHDRDDAVAVQVVRRVFVHAIVIVGIELERVEPVPVPRTVEHRLGAVRVEPRDHVDDVLSQVGFRRVGGGCRWW